MNKSSTHAEICKDLNELYQRKNADYGDSFGKSYQEYGMVMACIRLEDKLNRLKSLTGQEAKVADESIEDTLMDLANYAIMTLVERKVQEIPEEITEEEMRKRIRDVCTKTDACKDCPLYHLPSDVCHSEGADLERNYNILRKAGLIKPKMEE